MAAKGWTNMAAADELSRTGGVGGTCLKIFGSPFVREIVITPPLTVAVSDLSQMLTNTGTKLEAIKTIPIMFSL